MTTQGLVGDRRPGIAAEGDGWSGVTRQQKLDAGGQCAPDETPEMRAYVAARNTNQVAAQHGSRHWTGSAR